MKAGCTWDYFMGFLGEAQKAHKAKGRPLLSALCSLEG